MMATIQRSQKQKHTHTHTMATIQRSQKHKHTHPIAHRTRPPSPVPDRHLCVGFPCVVADSHATRLRLRALCDVPYTCGDGCAYALVVVLCPRPLRSQSVCRSWSVIWLLLPSVARATRRRRRRRRRRGEPRRRDLQQWVVPAVAFTPTRRPRSAWRPQSPRTRPWAGRPRGS